MWFLFGFLFGVSRTVRVIVVVLAALLIALLLGQNHPVAACVFLAGVFCYLLAGQRQRADQRRAASYEQGDAEPVAVQRAPAPSYRPESEPRVFDE